MAARVPGGGANGPGADHVAKSADTSPCTVRPHRSWARGRKGALCGGTHLGSLAEVIGAGGGWLTAFGVTRGEAQAAAWQRVVGERAHAQ
jgi:hypothetical protein